MNKYPSVNQANALAKYISKTLGIKLSYAKEAVAYMHACSNFHELCNKAGLSFKKEIGMNLPIPIENDLVKLRSLLTPHMSALRAHLAPEIHLNSSVVAKAANEKIHHLSRKIVELLLATDEIDWSSSESVISYLEFCDDSPSQVLVGINSNLPIVNPWIEPQALGLRVYGYYNHNGKYLDIIIREFEFKFKSPRTSKELEHRNWFTPYVIGYLSYLAKQLTSVGYQGNLRLCGINRLRARNIIDFKEQNHFPKFEEQPSPFNKLLELGGRWDWDGSGDSEPSDLGVTVSLSSLARNVIH